MNPADVFCPNIECPARGQISEGNISVHSKHEKRYQCEVCQTTFAATKGTLFYRLRTDPRIVMWVITLRANGCPPQAIVAAFRLDERTVRKWWQRAGEQCKAIHTHVVGGSQLDLQQVQADEIKVKTQRGTIWMAMAMMISTRLPSLVQCRAHCIGIDWTRWLGGVISATQSRTYWVGKRDKRLICALAEQIRTIALCRPLLLAVDGLPSYVDAFRKAFRSKLPHRAGEQGRFRLISWPDIAIVQVVKKRIDGLLIIERRTEYCRTCRGRQHRDTRQVLCKAVAKWSRNSFVAPKVAA